MASSSFFAAVAPARSPSSTSSWSLAACRFCSCWRIADRSSARSLSAVVSSSWIPVSSLAYFWSMPASCSGGMALGRAARRAASTEARHPRTALALASPKPGMPEIVTEETFAALMMPDELRRCFSPGPTPGIFASAIRAPLRPLLMCSARSSPKARSISCSWSVLRVDLRPPKDAIRRSWSAFRILVAASASLAIVRRRAVARLRPAWIRFSLCINSPGGLEKCPLLKDNGILAVGEEQRHPDADHDPHRQDGHPQGEPMRDQPKED